MSLPIAILSEPFPPDIIKQRKGNFGQTLDYVEASTVIQRLNDSLEGRWSFTIVDYQTDADEVIVRGRMEIDGTIREQFGTSKISRKKDTNESISWGDDLKAAASDCLKKLASTFGVGLYLYQTKPLTDHSQSNNGNGQNYSSNNLPNHSRSRSNGNNRVTNEMIANLFSSAKNSGVSQAEIIRTANELFRKPISQLTHLEAKQLLDQFQLINI